MDGVARRGFTTYADQILGKDADRRSAGLWMQRHFLPAPDTRPGLRHCIKTAQFLWKDDQREKAIAVLEVALQSGISRYGSSDADVLGVTNQLVTYLCDMADDHEDRGDLSAARDLAERAQLVETRETATRPDFILAQVLKRLGDFDESARLQRRVLAHSTERLGPTDLGTVHSMIQLSNVLYLRGHEEDTAEALLLARQARSIAIATYGEESQVAVLASELFSVIEQSVDGG